MFPCAQNNGALANVFGSLLQQCLVLGQHGGNNGNDKHGDGGTMNPTRTKANALLLVWRIVLKL